MDVPEVGPEQNSSWFSASAPRSITKLAMDANMSGHQRKQALCAASILAEVLEAAIEAEKPSDGHCSGRSRLCNFAETGETPPEAVPPKSTTSPSPWPRNSGLLTDTQITQRGLIRAILQTVGAPRSYRLAVVPRINECHKSAPKRSRLKQCISHLVTLQGPPYSGQSKD